MKTYAQRMKKPQPVNLQQTTVSNTHIGNLAMGAMMGYDISQSTGDPALENKMRARLQTQFGSPVQNSHGESGGVPLPSAIQNKFEEKSGVPLDDVRVHYNSDKPSNFGALAYTHGANVYLGSGQEEHLNHEVTHVVQQKQGVVRPTGSIDGIPVNTEKNMEHRADTSDVTWTSVPLYDNVGEPVMQMKYPSLNPQEGNNCGFHALARVLLELGVWGEYEEAEYEKNSAKVNELTRYAAENNLTATGEAFDPEVLVKAGNGFCATHNTKCKREEDKIQCQTVSFANQADLTFLFELCSKKGAKILFPYNADDQFKPSWYDDSNQEELGAHWAAIDTVQKEKTDNEYDLYEGNEYGVKKEEEEESPNAPTFPARVTINQLFNSNKSISDKFDWKNFYDDKAQIIVDNYPEATKEIVAAYLMSNEYNQFRGTKEIFNCFDDFSKTLESIKNPTDDKETYADGKENVTLKGKAIVIAKEGVVTEILEKLAQQEHESEGGSSAEKESPSSSPAPQLINKGSELAASASDKIGGRQKRKSESTADPKEKKAKK